LTSERHDIYFDEQNENKRHLNKNLRVFFICLAIASVMWLMVRLSDNYIHNVVVSLNYKGIQKNKILIPSSDTLVIASIQSAGYNIIYNRLLNKRYSVQMDLNQYPARQNGKFYEIFIETPTLTNKLVSFLKPGEKLISVYPSVLKIKLERAYTKKVPVIANVDINYKKQFNIYKHIYIEPDSVFVTGNKKRVDSVKYVETEKKELNDLSENTYLHLKLINPENTFNLRYSDNEVKMYVPVAQYTEEYVDIPITFDSIPGSYQVIAYPDKVRCYFLISIPDHNKLSVDSFRAGFREAGLLHSKHNVAQVILKKVPHFVKIQRIEPDNIEYLIRRK